MFINVQKCLLMFSPWCGKGFFSPRVSFQCRLSYGDDDIDDDDDNFYIALFSALEQTRCARM